MSMLNVQHRESCNTCGKNIDCYNVDHSNPLGCDDCPIDHCEKCEKPIHHLECMAIVDWTPNGNIWCDKCYEEYYQAETMEIRVGRTIDNSENGGYQHFDANLTIGEIIYQLNREFDIRTDIESDKHWLDGNMQQIIEDMVEGDKAINFDQFPNLSEMWDYIHNTMVNSMLDIKYPHRHEFMGKYSYGHWAFKVTLQVWRIKWKGNKFDQSVERGIFIHTLEPWTTLKDIARDVHEGRNLS